MSELDREVLFQNESFFIGMIQAVAGGSIVGALSQVEVLKLWVGSWPLLFFLTSSLVAISLASFSAYWRHQYKMWDVKAHASKCRNEPQEAATRSELASCNLRRMRSGMLYSLVSLLAGIAVLVLGLWLRAICNVAA